MPEDTKRVEIGRLGKPYGLGGDLKFRGEPVIEELQRVYLEGLGYRLIEEMYSLNNETVIHLSGVNSRDDAERVSSLRVYADADELPELEEGAHYYFQLIGKTVFVDGKPFGEVADIEDAGAQDLLVIKHSGTSLRAQNKTHLVPLQAPYVRLEADGIHIEPIPGLLD
ncbi:MAG: 16S rRNA processing protein RimM [Meiothermus sp.]